MNKCGASSAISTPAHMKSHRRVVRKPACYAPLEVVKSVQICARELDAIATGGTRCDVEQPGPPDIGTDTDTLFGSAPCVTGIASGRGNSNSAHATDSLARSDVSPWPWVTLFGALQHHVASADSDEVGKQILRLAEQLWSSPLSSLLLRNEAGGDGGHRRSDTEQNQKRAARVMQVDERQRTTISITRSKEDEDSHSSDRKSGGGCYVTRQRKGRGRPRQRGTARCVGDADVDVLPAFHAALVALSAAAGGAAATLTRTRTGAGFRSAAAKIPTISMQAERSFGVLGVAPGRREDREGAGRDREHDARRALGDWNWTDPEGETSIVVRKDSATGRAPVNISSEANNPTIEKFFDFFHRIPRSARTVRTFNIALAAIKKAPHTQITDKHDAAEQLYADLLAGGARPGIDGLRLSPDDTTWNTLLACCRPLASTPAGQISADFFTEQKVDQHGVCDGNTLHAPLADHMSEVRLCSSEVGAQLLSTPGHNKGTLSGTIVGLTPNTSDHALQRCHLPSPLAMFAFVKHPSAITLAGILRACRFQPADALRFHFRMLYCIPGAFSVQASTCLLTALRIAGQPFLAYVAGYQDLLRARVVIPPEDEDEGHDHQVAAAEEPAEEPRPKSELIARPNENDEGRTSWGRDREMAPPSVHDQQRMILTRRRNARQAALQFFDVEYFIHLVAAIAAPVRLLRSQRNKPIKPADPDIAAPSQHVTEPKGKEAVVGGAVHRPHSTPSVETEGSSSSSSTSTTAETLVQAGGGTTSTTGMTRSRSDCIDETRLAVHPDLLGLLRCKNVAEVSGGQQQSHLRIAKRRRTASAPSESVCSSVPFVQGNTARKPRLLSLSSPGWCTVGVSCEDTLSDAFASTPFPLNTSQESATRRRKGEGECSASAHIGETASTSGMEDLSIAAVCEDLQVALLAQLWTEIPHRHRADPRLVLRVLNCLVQPRFLKRGARRCSATTPAAVAHARKVYLQYRGSIRGQQSFSWMLTSTILVHRRIEEVARLHGFRQGEA
ncbi:unnamed protein product [Amoebophrya sp. A120]|nr:unnamed protein product [Amoebophrya sp. A120]|eukprot:GSA120T00022773001.1